MARKQADVSERSVSWRSSSGYEFDQGRLPMVAGGAAASRFVEFATLITNGHGARGRRGLAVCGASAGTGVSFVAANLALATAGAGAKTHLIESNFRDPGIANAIRAPVAIPGLSDFLLDPTLSAADVTASEVLPGLSVTYAGARREDASDFLSSTRFDEFLEICLRAATLTILDTPPSNRCADATVVARAVGYALIVGRRGRTFYEDVAALSEHLRREGVVIIGTVLNNG